MLFKRPLDLHQTSFALGEAIAHLHTLWFQGRLERRLDADGIYASCRPEAAPPRQSKAGTASWRSTPRAASTSGITERTTSQKRGLWFISRRCASSCATT